MLKNNYYSNQLKRLEHDPDFFKTVKLHDSNGNATKNMDLNLDSIPVLIAFLKTELARLDSNLTKGTKND